jgi:broad specificity phosphatase PhoE
VLYGRLPGFGLSDDGRRMARQAAEYVQSLDRPVTALVCSPLQRTQESSEPFTELFGLEPRTDERVIEPTNVFEGRRMLRALVNPWNWRHLRKPALPSWGEPYAEVIARMNEAMTEAWETAESGDVVIVSHQLPIWITHLAVAGLPSRHDPRDRRCALSSVTSFEMDEDGKWTEVAYAEPVSLSGAVDVGAV